MSRRKVARGEGEGGGGGMAAVVDKGCHERVAPGHSYYSSGL